MQKESLKAIAAQERAKQEAIEADLIRKLGEQELGRLAATAEENRLRILQREEATRGSREFQRLSPYLEALGAERLLTELREYWQVGQVEKDTKPTKNLEYTGSAGYAVLYPVADIYSDELGINLVHRFPARTKILTGGTRFVRNGQIVDGQENGYDEPNWEYGTGSAQVGFRISVATESAGNPYFRAYYYGLGDSVEFRHGGKKTAFSLRNSPEANSTLSAQVESIFTNTPGVKLPSEIATSVRPEPARTEPQKPWYKSIFR